MKVCCSFSVTFSAYLHCVTCSSAGVNDAAAGGVAGGVAGVNADAAVGVAGVNADAATGGVNADAVAGGVDADAVAGVGVVAGVDADAGGVASVTDAVAAGVDADASMAGGKAGALPPLVPSSHSILGRFRCIPDELCTAPMTAPSAIYVKSATPWESKNSRRSFILSRLWGVNPRFCCSHEQRRG